MQRLIAIILFIISFFVPGDMSKANVYPNEKIAENATKAEFVFENKTGNRLEIGVTVDSVERKSIGSDDWIPVSFQQVINGSIANYKLYPNEKITLHVNFIDPKTGEDVPLVAGDYRITVTYKMSGYTDNESMTKSFDFTVDAPDW